MKAISFRAIVLSVLFLSSSLYAQERPSGIEHFLATGKTIFIAKCKNVGPVNILLRAEVELEVIHVVTGSKLPSNISVVSQYGMEKGLTYLLRSEDEYLKNTDRLRITTRDSVILIPDYVDISKLIAYPPRTIVLRTMNTRIDHLTHKIAGLNYELEMLKKARVD